MSRPPKPYKRELIRAQIRKRVALAARAQLAKDNVFNPNKPEHGAMSSLIEQLLIDWLLTQDPTIKRENLLRNDNI